jgi:hypothetical protein
MREDDRVKLLFERKDFARERVKLTLRHGLAKPEAINARR